MDRSRRARQGREASSDTMDKKIQSRGMTKPSAAYGLIPLFSFIMLFYTILLKMNMLQPFIAKDIGTATVYMLVAEIALLVVLVIAYSRKEKEESDEVDYLKKKYVDEEEDIGVSVRGRKVDGESLTEVEPEYVEAEVVADDDEDDDKAGSAAAAAAAGPATFIPTRGTRVPPQVSARPVPVPAPVARPMTAAIPGLKGDWKVFEYPKQAPGAIYSDVLIPINMKDKVLLKHRTLVAKACLQCEDQVMCWPKARRVMSKDDFIANTECKDGLRSKGASV